MRTKKKIRMYKDVVEGKIDMISEWIYGRDEGEVSLVMLGILA